MKARPVMSPPQSLVFRILSIDGDGIEGLNTASVLHRFEVAMRQREIAAQLCLWLPSSR